MRACVRARSTAGFLDVASSSRCAVPFICVSVTGAGVPLERSVSAPASSAHSVGTRPQEQGRPALGRSLSKTEAFRK